MLRGGWMKKLILLKYIAIFSLLVGVIGAIFNPVNASATGLINISGKILDQTNSGVSNVKVYALLPGTTQVAYGATTSSSDGSYVLGVLPGNYDLYFVPSANPGVNPVRYNNVSVSAPINFDVSLTIILNKFSGTVRNLDGVPQRGVSVSIMNGATGLVREVVTTESGAFELYAKPDSYQLSVKASGTGYLPDFSITNIYDKQVNLEQTDYTQDIVVPITHLTVKVQYEDGTPAPAFSNVRFYTKIASDVALLPNLVQQVQYNDVEAYTNAQGTVSLPVIKGVKYQSSASTSLNYVRALVNGQRYFYTGASMELNNDTTIIIIIPPLTPTNLTGPTYTNSMPSLSWNSSGLSDSFNVYRDGVKIGSVLQNQYTDSLSENGSHNYQVTAVYAGKESLRSNPITIVYDTAQPMIELLFDRQANANGWYNSAVTASFVCADSLSGILNCPSPISLDTEGASINVTGTTSDRAGNNTTINQSINLDKTQPTIQANVSPTPNTDGWNNTDVNVTYSCADALSGVDICENGQLYTQDGKGLLAGGNVVDKAGNEAEVMSTLNVDRAAPVVGNIIWSNNPKAISATSEFTASATETNNPAGVSGIKRAEYFMGDVDPGQGNGSSMVQESLILDGNNSVVDASFRATLSTNFQPGVYKVNVRVLDAAGNWSTVTSDYLVVYDPAGPTDVAAHVKRIPQVSAGDILTGLVSDVQSDKASLDFEVLYTSTGAIDQRSQLEFKYATGQKCKTNQPENCHMTTFSATTLNPSAINWLTISGLNSSEASFQGIGQLNIDGVNTTNPFKIMATDGSRLTPVLDDSAVFAIYAIGANPSYAQPVYKVTLTGLSSWLKIQ